MRRGGPCHPRRVLLTLTMTALSVTQPATDLGHLLHKHPDRAQSFDVAAGRAHVFYPCARPDETTAALLLEIDPVALARGRSGPTRALGGWVDEQAYAGGSMLAVALGVVFSSALKGRTRERAELAATPVPLTVRVPTLPARGGPELVERLFAPLGWEVTATPVPLDPQLPGWGDSRFVDTTLVGVHRLADALSHLYVLLPVLDGAKHYRVGPDEVDKLLRAADAWLPLHPDKELITTRYLAHRRAYVESALERLGDGDGDATPDPPDPPDPPRPLAAQRRAGVLAALREAGARRVLDLGCGDGALLRDLLDDPVFVEVVGVDVSPGALDAAARRLRPDRMPKARRTRLVLRQSALTYTDATLAGYDAAVLMEVIEHVDPERLPALEHAVFAVARPGTVVVTTPNAEHNVRFPALAAAGTRHADHRFEWTRAQFRDWAGGVAARRGYAVRFAPVGVDDPEVGPPTQLAVLVREEVGA